MSMLVFTEKDLTARGMEKYRADLERRLRATGVIGSGDYIDISDYDLRLEVESHVTHLDGDGIGGPDGWTVHGSSFAVRDAPAERPEKKRWWRR